MISTTNQLPLPNLTSHPVPTIRPTAETPPPTSGGLEAFDGWLSDRLDELMARFESYKTASSSHFHHDRR